MTTSDFHTKSSPYASVTLLQTMCSNPNRGSLSYSAPDLCLWSYCKKFVCRTITSSQRKVLNHCHKWQVKSLKRIDMTRETSLKMTCYLYAFPWGYAEELCSVVLVTDWLVQHSKSLLNYSNETILGEKITLKSHFCQLIWHFRNGLQDDKVGTRSTVTKSFPCF